VVAHRTATQHQFLRGKAGSTNLPSQKLSFISRHHCHVSLIWVHPRFASAADFARRTYKTGMHSLILYALRVRKIKGLRNMAEVLISNTAFKINFSGHKMQPEYLATNLVTNLAINLVANSVTNYLFLLCIKIKMQRPNTTWQIPKCKEK